jgi:quercetin 2,3-dioxygenase
VGDATVRVLVGAGSPLQLHAPARYYDVALPPHGQTALAVPAGFQGFVYALQGVVALGSTLAAAHATQIAVLGEGSAEGSAEEGALRAQAGPEGARFVLAAGQPHREPVRFNGNFVD